MADGYYGDGTDLDAEDYGYDDWVDGAAFRLNGELVDGSGNRIRKSRKKRKKEEREEAAKKLRDTEEGVAKDTDKSDDKSTALEKEESGGIAANVGGKKDKLSSEKEPECDDDYAAPKIYNILLSNMGKD